MTSPEQKHVGPSRIALLGKVANWPSPQARQWALAQIPRLCEAPTTCAVVVFGSVVRNVATPTDLDLLYVFDGRPVEYEKPPIDVDLRKFEKKQIDHALSAGNDLIGWCIRYGELACERHQYWSNIVRTWKDQLGLPPASVAIERAQKSERLLREMLSLGDDDAALEIYLAMLTQLARAHLIERGIYPASRPELPKQLRSVGEATVANYLHDALRMRNALVHSGTAPDRQIWRRFLEAWDSKAKTKKAS